ncbi:GNAT family N-acetyltransferase [Roseibacterium sp. SDUM158016]|uniref:GNAT family N-acetyltransferase n=1 Tax=Roseicyclus sediminis TaxID=2980997 RepID=UPI0021CDF713|nr:GNAT family N-acetyltransferase [Roseibacterium sp. SDUM158016]MCU4654396.1 GNAT family N-acetyltransferase [Roseibacterium sp. SDUM158016]
MSPERMAEIHAAAFADGEAWDRDAIASLMERPGTVAVSGGDHGFALLQIIPPEAELLTIAIAPAAQGQGHGHALMEMVLDAATARGCSVLHLEVAADNRAARALYAAAGLVETGRRQGYYRRPGGVRTDALTLTITLPARQTGTADET